MKNDSKRINPTNTVVEGYKLLLGVRRSAVQKVSAPIQTVRSDTYRRITPYSLEN
jgi:hypothetical protein